MSQFFGMATISWSFICKRLSAAVVALTWKYSELEYVPHGCRTVELRALVRLYICALAVL
jgi:hypothetical protein